MVVPNLAAMANQDPVGTVMMQTALGVSPTVPPAQILISLIIFTVLYLGLGIIWFLLMRRYVLEGVYTPPKEVSSELKGSESNEAESLSFGY